MQGFVKWYNTEHKHSALRYVTPLQRHTGEDITLLQQRTKLYQQAKAKHPERWSKNERDWSHQNEVWLNPSQTEKPHQMEVKSAA